MIEQALTFLHRSPAAYIDMIAPIERGTAEIIAADSAGVLLLERTSNAHMLAAADDDKALALLNRVAAPVLMSIHGRAPSLCAAETFGLTLTLICNQAVWTKPQLPEIPASPYQIRLLDMDYADEVNRIYSHPIGLAYIESRIQAQELWGAFDGNDLAGFIGCHGEGSMGLLEVLLPYRRQGVGKLLAAFLVNEMRGKGLPAFSQFAIDNAASRRLNAALGMEISEEIVCWLE